MKIRGFSLIELLVVVAIISVLAAVALPLYRAYTVKAKIANIMSFMDNCAETIFSTYQTTGNWPATAKCGGVQMSNGSTLVQTPSLNNLGIYSMYYQGMGYGNLSVSVITTGLSGIGSSYQDGTVCPNGGSTCNNLIRSAYRDNGTTLTKKCGLDVPGTWSVPLNFQPPNCNCTNINNYLQYNSSTC